MSNTELINGLLHFLHSSPSPFHAVLSASRILLSAGFVQVDESEKWRIDCGGKYFCIRNGSSLIAFSVPEKPSGAFVAVGAHTDSPCLKVKPNSLKVRNGFAQLAVQTYGGGLWHTWFDRDLGVAGRAVFETPNGLVSKLVMIDKPILRIPTLAIHLDRSVDDGFKFNKETQLLPIASGVCDSQNDALLKLISSELPDGRLSDVELSLFDVQRPTIGGITSEYIFSARLDNLLMSYCALRALISAASNSHTNIVALFDHEEVGSQSAYGADSAFIESTLGRILKATNASLTIDDVTPRSFFVSADCAHALHPNYADKHEDNHKPTVNGGTVIKHNANQRYATTSLTAAIVRRVARRSGIPVQDFCVRNDSPCGSTIGPMLSARLGVRTVDVGCPILSMHSIRKMCGVDDVQSATKLLAEIFNQFSDIQITE